MARLPLESIRFSEYVGERDIDGVCARGVRTHAVGFLIERRNRARDVPLCAQNVIEHDDNRERGNAKADEQADREKHFCNDETALVFHECGTGSGVGVTVEPGGGAC